MKLILLKCPMCKRSVDSIAEYPNAVYMPGYT